MNQRVQSTQSAPVSTTSAVDPRGETPRARASFRGMLHALVWTLLFLALFDVAVSVAVPDNTLQGGAAFLFNSGFSNEHKLRQALACEDEAPPLLLDYGWIGEWDDLPTAPSLPEKRLVASYGMSFSHRLSKQLPEVDPTVELRLIGGPGAPLNHAFASYLEDRDRHDAKIVILGVLSSSLPLLRSMNLLTCTEVPAVYTYPRFSVVDGELQSVKPVIASVTEMRAAADDPEVWQRFVAQLRDHDSYYSPVSFRQDPIDGSTIGRVLRRAWGQRHYRQTSAREYGEDGFDPDSETVQVARAILREFGRTARADGRVPVVVLFDNTSLDNLDRVFRETLVEERIPFVSSHEWAPSTDPTNFLPDRHFTPEVDRLLATQVLRVVAEDDGATTPEETSRGAGAPLPTGR